MESVGGEPESIRRADIAIVAVDAGPASGLLSQQTASMTAECELPMPIERQETYLVIRDRETMRVAIVVSGNTRVRGASFSGIAPYDGSLPTIGASPMEARRQLATIADSSGLQRGRIRRKCRRNS